MYIAVPSTDPRSAADLLQAGTAHFVDVREDDEFAAGHVPGSLHVPLGSFMDSVAQLPRSRPLILVCRSGARSAHATRVLRSAGIDATNLHGGMIAWQQAQLPMEPADGHII